MKRVVFWFVLFVMVFAFTACGSEPVSSYSPEIEEDVIEEVDVFDEDVTEEKIKFVVFGFDSGVMAGDAFEIELYVISNGDIHGFFEIYGSFEIITSDNIELDRVRQYNGARVLEEKKDEYGTYSIEDSKLIVFKGLDIENGDLVVILKFTAIEKGPFEIEFIISPDNNVGFAETVIEGMVYGSSGEDINNEKFMEVIVELGEFSQGDGTQFMQCWVTDGTDSLQNQYSAEDFNRAGMLVLEFAEPIVGEDGEDVVISIAWIGDAADFTWYQTEYAISAWTTVADIDLTKYLENYEMFTQSELVKLYLLVEGGADTLGITRAYLAPKGFKPFIPITGFGISAEE